MDLIVVVALATPRSRVDHISKSTNEAMKDSFKFNNAISNLGIVCASLLRNTITTACRSMAYMILISSSLIPCMEVNSTQI